MCQEIIDKDGWMGMFKGNSFYSRPIPFLQIGWWSQVVALGVSNFVYFYCYNMLKVIIQKKTKMTITPFTNLAVGAVHTADK